MVVVPLPPVPELASLLSALLGRDVKVTKGGDGPAAVAAVAHYRSDAPVLEVVVLADLPIAAGLAAALSLVPADQAEALVEGGALDASLSENFAEVMNVVARWVSGSGQRFGLQAVRCLPEALPEELLAAAQGSDEKRAMAVVVPGYGSGRLAFCTL